MPIDPTALSPERFATIARDLETQRGTAESELRRLTRERRALAYPARVERNDSARTRRAGLSKEIARLRDDLEEIADAQAQAQAHADHYGLAEQAFAQLEGRFHALRVEVREHVQALMNSGFSDVAQAKLNDYGRAVPELMALSEVLIRLTGDRGKYSDEWDARERLVSNRNSARLIDRLPTTPPTRWPWMDHVDTIMKKGQTKAEPLTAVA